MVRSFQHTPITQGNLCIKSFIYPKLMIDVLFLNVFPSLNRRHIPSRTFSLSKKLWKVSNAVCLILNLSCKYQPNDLYVTCEFTIPYLASHVVRFPLFFLSTSCLIVPNVQLLCPQQLYGASTLLFGTLSNK